MAYLKLHRIQPKPGETAVCTGNSDEDDNFDIEISESEGDGSPSDKDMLKNPSMMKTGNVDHHRGPAGEQVGIEEAPASQVTE